MTNSDPKLPPGTNYCRCRGCGEYFGGVRAFDLHRIGPGGDRSCLPPARVANRKGEVMLRLSEKGYWIGKVKEGAFK